MTPGVFLVITEQKRNNLHTQVYEFEHELIYKSAPSTCSKELWTRKSDLKCPTSQMSLNCRKTSNTVRYQDRVLEENPPITLHLQAGVDAFTGQRGKQLLNVQDP